MASSIPAARTNLIARLNSLTGTGGTLEGVKVLRTDAWDTVKERDVVTVRNARDISREPRLGGRNFVETYTIPVHVFTIRSGRDLEAVELRLWALVGAVEQAILSDASLGGVVVVGAMPAGADRESSGPAADGDAVVAELTLNVECEARTTLAA